MKDEREQRTGGAAALVVSILMHGSVAAVFLFGGMHYLDIGGAHPGTAAPGAIEANLVHSLPGGAIPMPSPVTKVTKNRLANNSPGKTVTRPRPRSTPRKSVALPSNLAENLARQEAMQDLQKLARADRPKKKQDQRVAYGAGGRVSFSASTAAASAGGGGGVTFGDANFGHLYTNWVNTLRDRLQYYWNQQPRDPSLPTGQRVTVMLVVQHSGLINGIRYVSRSSSLGLNQMAFRTVQQLAAGEKFPLPAGYKPSSLTVSVAFELN